ncbi:MAG: hypothetical protein QOI25_2778, partial [Mycobacterium sp.]|nr:hypothetical protein [Mycobacterium sp.]
MVVLGERHPDHVDDTGVKGVFGAVAESDPLPDRVILRRQFDRECGGQACCVARVGHRQPVGGAGLAGTDRDDVNGSYFGVEHGFQPPGGDIGGVTRYRHGGDHGRTLT